MSIRRAAAGLRSCPMRIRRWACASHLAVIALLSLLPAWLFPPSIAEIPGIDKWMHLAMYGVLGALLRWVAGQGPLSPAARGLPAAGAGYGLVMEVLQPWIGGAGRAFNWEDAAANLAGVVLFWIAAGRLLDGDEIMPSI